MKKLFLFCLLWSGAAFSATNWLSLGTDTVPATDDEVLTLDVSDSSMSASGTVKRVLIEDLQKRTSVAKTANYTVTTDEFVIFTDATGGGFTITTYTPVGNKDRTIQIHKEDYTANDIAIIGTGPDLPVVLTSHGTVSLQSDGTEWHVMQKTPIIAPSFKSETLISAATGIYYAFGFYNWSATEANLTQAAPTATIGSAGVSYGAHAAIVAGAAGTASGGAGAVEIEVSGTSITDAGVETTSDTEILVADITALATDEYAETIKKWTGIPTFTLQNAGGSTQTTFAVDVNYGLSAYEDRSNRDFTITASSMRVVGGASDSGFDIELLHHQATGWTYAASSFVPGDGPIAALSTDSPTNMNLVNGESMRWKRDNLSTVVAGSIDEGYIARITTGANNSVRLGNLSVGVEF